MNIKIALFVFALFINSSAWSAEKKAVPSAEPTLAAGVEKTKAKTQSEAEKLYQRYQRLY